MGEVNKSKSPKKRPFRWTKELVRLALNDGWTQKEIADKCRTQQSVVSDWKKGSKLSTEQQLKPLLELYGHKLRRSTFRVYWSHSTEEKKFYRVEGKVILSQAFSDLRRDTRGKLVKKIPLYKLVIHYQGGDQFLAIIQSRLTFRKTNEELECSVEDAIWSSNFSELMTSIELIKFVDSYAEKNLHEFQSDAITLSFLLRQALLNHGIPVDGIVEYPSVW